MSTSDHRRPIVHRVALAVATAGLLIGTASCGGSDKADGPPPKTNIGVPATATAATTATTAATAARATATTAPTPTGVPDATAAASALYGAWKAGDRTAAAAVAEPPAVDGVFAATPGDYALYNHCNTGEFDAAACLYRGDPGTIQFSMAKQGPNWVVVEAFFSPA